MKKLYRITCFLLCIALMLCLVACNGNSTQPTNESNQDSISIVFSEKLLGVAEVSPEDWIESLNNLGEGQYIDLYVNSDEKSVTLEVSETQKDYWKSIIDQGLQKLVADFRAIDSDYDIQYSEDYESVDLYYNLDLSATNAVYYVIYCEVYCAFGQLLNGAEPSSWLVSFNIYNSDTGKLVTSGDSETGMAYETSDWEASK